MNLSNGDFMKKTGLILVTFGLIAAICYVLLMDDINPSFSALLNNHVQV